MKASDICVGDWVEDGYKKVQVTSITCDGIVETTAAISNIEVVEPIPLTEDILVKNGFEKAYTKVHGIMVDENLWFGHIGANYVELRLEGNVAIWKDYDEKADGLYSNYLFPLPTSVHQLQHLMRLCGIEKEIEL